MPSLVAQLEIQQIPSKELDEEILQGQPAPFTGVLIYPDIYREYQATIDKYKYRVSRDNQNMPLCPEVPSLTVFDNGTMLKVGIGLLIGLTLGFTLGH